MTVKELVELLQAMPNQDAIVILQKDSEGNGYSPLSGADGENQSYIAETTWYGEVKYAELTEELKEKGYSEEDTDEDKEGEPCVVLWPVN